MQTLIATALLIGILMAGMALGLIFRGRSLSGSCGGTGKACECSEAKRKRCIEENA